MTTAANVLNLTRRYYAPPPRTPLSAWADEHRRLAPEASAEPGAWSTARVPYLREVMDAVTDPEVERIVLVSASQVGKTENLLNTIGYHVHRDPAPILLLEPTLDMAAAVAKDRIAPMVRDTPVLRARLATPRARDGQNTTLHKTFPGGHLTLAGANSPASLASRPIRILLCDEVDRWPATLPNEGDPLSIAEARTTTFQRRKIVIVSSPTVDGASRIQHWWKLSSQARYLLPCPHCRVGFALEWAVIKYDDHDPATTRIECPTCHRVIPATQRDALVAAGRWEHTHPELRRFPGYHVPGFVAPWRSLEEHVRTNLAARQSVDTHQVWKNTVAGEWWEIPGKDAPLEPAVLLARREKYAAEVPAGVCLLTCGVDTQDDRLEALVVGWGVGEECWVIARETLPGDPARPEVWEEFDQLIGRAWAHETAGWLRIHQTFIDSAGHRTHAIYAQVVPRQARRRVTATIGSDGGTNGVLVEQPKIIPLKNGTGTVHRRRIDVSQCKAILYTRLRLIQEPGPEYLHFPMTVGEPFFDELTAEVFQTQRNKRGFQTKAWEKIRDRNEALDALVLAFAAMRTAAPDANRMAAFAARIAPEVLTEHAMRAHHIAQVVPTPPSPPPPARRPWLARRGGWLQGRG